MDSIDRSWISCEEEMRDMSQRQDLSLGIVAGNTLTFVLRRDFQLLQKKLPVALSARQPDNWLPGFFCFIENDQGTRADLERSLTLRPSKTP
jgi:hypothetical protein